MKRSIINSLFTIRNGSINNPTDKTYAEKLLIVKQGQLTP